jgi:hypothetical protein
LPIRIQREDTPDLSNHDFERLQSRKPQWSLFDKFRLAFALAKEDELFTPQSLTVAACRTAFHYRHLVVGVETCPTCK